MNSKSKNCGCGFCLPDGQNGTRPVKVYVANFGKENCLWQECLEGNTIVTLDRKALNKFWEAQKKECYIKYCQDNIKTTKGKPLPKNVASRWYNLVTKLKATSCDVWIHRDKERLYWTLSTDEEAVKEVREIKKQELGVKFCVFHKPCTGWSCKDKKGKPLLWANIHPKARKFLKTTVAFQRLSEDNANYAIALIKGSGTRPWHERPEWEAEKVRNFVRGKLLRQELKVVG